MSEYVIGRVKTLYKYDDGYEVTVDVQGDGGGFSIEIRTPHDDPQQAIEAARDYLAKLGKVMAQEFASAGSLS